MLGDQWKTMFALTALCHATKNISTQTIVKYIVASLVLWDLVKTPTDDVFRGVIKRAFYARHPQSRVTNVTVTPTIVKAATWAPLGLVKTFTVDFFACSVCESCNLKFYYLMQDNAFHGGILSNFCVLIQQFLVLPSSATLTIARGVT